MKLFVNDCEAPVTGTLFECAESVNVRVPTSCVKQGNAASVFSRSSRARSFSRSVHRKKRTSAPRFVSHAALGSRTMGPFVATRCVAGL